MSNTFLYTIDPEKCTESLKDALLNLDDVTKVEFPPGDLGIIIVTANMSQKKVLKYIHKYVNIKSKKSWTPFKKPKPKPSPPSPYASADDAPGNEDTSLDPPSLPPLYDPYNSQSTDTSLNPPPPRYDPYNSQSTHTHDPTVYNQAEFISFPDGLSYQNQYPSNNYSSFSHYPSESQTHEPGCQYFSDNYPSQFPYTSNYYSSEPHDPHSQQHPTMQYDMNQPPEGYPAWGSYHYRPETGQSSGYRYGSNDMQYNNNMGDGRYGHNYDDHIQSNNNMGSRSNEMQYNNDMGGGSYGHSYDDHVQSNNNMGDGSSSHNNNSEGCVIM